MTGSIRIAALAVASIAVASPAAPPPLRGVASIAEHSAQCRGKSGWSDPAPPVRIFANVYDVGTCGITVVLIVGDRGAILIDGATAAAVPSIVANIERLGIRPGEVRLLLSSHEHVDHAGGLNALRARTGATMVATAAAKAPLETGVAAIGDPQRTDGAPAFRGVRVDRVVRDGEIVTLGSLRLTAHATPAHAPGSTSWSWRACADRVCRRIVYADSVSAIASGSYRFVDHPAYVATFRRTLATIARLPCDLLITPHPGASALYERLAGIAPLAAPNACAAYAAAAGGALDAQLAGEIRSVRR